MWAGWKRARRVEIVSGIIPIWLLGAVFSLAPLALAQEFRGQISGRIVEASGASVANAKVTVKNTGTGVAVTATSDENGDYKVLYLLPGRYAVEVEATGFKKTVRGNIEIRVGDRVGLDLSLEVGDLQETVNVTADTPLLETTSASAGQVIDQRRIGQELLGMIQHRGIRGLDLPAGERDQVVVRRRLRGRIRGTGPLQGDRKQFFFERGAVSAGGRRDLLRKHSPLFGLR